MAGFYLISCPDPAERSARIEEARSRISPFPCPMHVIAKGDVSLVATDLPHISFLRHASADGSLTVVLGTPIGESGFISAEEMAYLTPERTTRLSGLFVRFDFLPDGSFSIQGDPFSIIPVFHHQGGRFPEVSTSPNAIRCQAGFKPVTDPIGIARYMMGHGSSGPRTLDESIRLLGNRRLTWTPGSEVRLTGLPKLLPTADPLPKDPVEAGEEANAMIADAIRRHASDLSAGSRCDMLFSGGLDSRLILSHLIAQGIHPHCITRGLPTDDEVKIARAAARKARCPWHLADDGPHLMLASADRSVRLSSLQSGFSSTSFNFEPPPGHAFSPVTFQGFLMDSMLNPFSGVENPSEARDFETDFRTKINVFGISPETLSQLFRSEFRDAVSAAIGEIRDEWNQLPENPSVRRRHMAHAFRTCHHIGGVIWRSSFYSRPVTLAIDNHFFRRLMDFPSELFTNRRLERKMLVAMNRELAKIPLDGNTPHPKAIIKTFRYSAGRKLRLFREKWLPAPSHETRRYHRVLGMNGPALFPIRERADTLRHHLHEYFDPGALAAYFPFAGQPVPVVKDAITEHGGRRMLAGLAMHLATKP